jgi:hypothetical protein
VSGRRLSDVRAGSPLLIEELLTLMQPGIRPALKPHLPAGVVLRGCQGASRRSPHALFTLLLTEPRAATGVRNWLATPFLTDLLPSLLHSIERRVADFLRSDSVKRGHVAFQRVLDPATGSAQVCASGQSTGSRFARN